MLGCFMLCDYSLRVDVLGLFLFVGGFSVDELHDTLFRDLADFALEPALEILI
jgi:hypothetical protein